ncbi:uncharacterized protein LOC144148792 [Haemaphysalis longicornis]
MRKMADKGHKSGRLSRLDLKRDCSASGTRDACWLCDELENWNNTLNDLQLTLVEFQPGKLRLYVQTSKPAVGVADSDVLYDASCFTAWLIRKHNCISSISIKQGDPHWQVGGLPDYVPSASSNLRDISIEGYGPLDWASLLESLGHIAQLESLKLTDVVVDDKFLAKLVELLTENACSVKTVVLTRTSMWGNACDGFARCISRCGNLGELVLDVKLVMPTTTSSAKVWELREWDESPDVSDEYSSDEYSAVEDSIDWGNVSYSEELTTQDYQSFVEDLSSSDFALFAAHLNLDLKERNDTMLHELSDFLESSVALTSLSFNAFRPYHIAIIAKPLVTNSVLSDLVITYWGRHYRDPTRSCVGYGLRSLLSQNKGLRSLTIQNCVISQQGGRDVSEGLNANSTLERLNVNTTNPISVAVAWALCSALVRNKTLRTLRFGGLIWATNVQRVQLSRNLARCGLFGRVQLDWKNWDLKLLARYMLSPSHGPTDLCLQMHELSDAAITILCQALSESLCVETLTVHFSGATPPGHTAILQEALERNKSLRRVTLHDQGSTPRSAMEALQGLASNSCVTELALHCCRMDTACAELFGSLLASNEALCKVVLSCQLQMSTHSTDAVCKGLVQNCSITEWHASHSTPPMERTVQRNLTRLQRAVRFVLHPNTVKGSAEAFELLESKASLVSGLISASAMSKAEAESAVKAARKFIQDNYLFINQIVCHRLECYPGEGTQVDRLNFDCWRAVTKYLKVSDVVSGTL